MMTPAEFYFMVAQIFLARSLTPLTALLFAVMWLCVAIYFTGIASARGNNKAWWIVAESDDHGAMQAMAGLTDKYIKIKINHATEIITTRRE